MFGPGKDKVSSVGYHITRSFLICTGHLVLLGENLEDYEGLEVEWEDEGRVWWGNSLGNVTWNTEKMGG